MFAQTLRSDYKSSTYRNAATQDSVGIKRAKHDAEDVICAAGTHAAAIKDLLVVLSATEPHRDVAMRAQLVARDAPVSRTILITPRAGNWHAFVERMSKLGRRFAELGTDISARVLRASLSTTRTRVETCTPAEGIVTQANKSDLVLVGRRRTFPWFLAPLARYARRLLRRSRAPMLIVGARPTGAYRNVVIATDLATDIRPALKWARHIAPGASFTLLHVYRGLFESKLQWAAVPDKHIFEHRLAAQRQAEMGMAALANQHRSDNVGRALIAHGSPVQDVLRKARELGADLIVVVKTTHSWWAELVAASASVEIAARADQDVLVVHGASSRTSSVHSEEAERRT